MIVKNVLVRAPVTYLPYLVDLFPFMLLLHVAHCHGLGNSKPVKLRSGPSLLKIFIQNSPFLLNFSLSEVVSCIEQSQPDKTPNNYVLLANKS
jgi:hypothetical protein